MPGFLVWVAGTSISSQSAGLRVFLQLPNCSIVKWGDVVMRAPVDPSVVAPVLLRGERR